MKKTLVLAVLISALALSSTGCGTDKNDTSKADAVTSTSAVSSEKTEETSAKATKKISSTEQTTEKKETTVKETSEKAEETTVAVTTQNTQQQVTEQQNDEVQENEPVEDNQPQENNEPVENNPPQEDNLPEPDVENNIPEETPAPEITEPTGEFTVDDLVFEYNGQIINLNEHINDVKAKIGEPLDMTSAPSCYYDGDDKSFIYDGFTIYTYPDGENDYVVSIEFSTDAVSTIKGARVGMAVEEAIAIYGEGYSINGSNYQYQIDDRYMYFYVENGVIVNIGIVLAN